MPSSSLRCYYCNARSLKNKQADLYELLYHSHYNILSFSETWLSPIFTDGLLDPKSQYNIYRDDRHDGYGGVCIFICKMLQSYQSALSKDVIAEVQCIGCNVLCSDLKLIVYC